MSKSGAWNVNSIFGFEGRRSTVGRSWGLALVTFALAALSFPAVGAAQDGATTLEIDPDHSNFIVRASHLGASFTFIEFTDFTGSIEYNKEEPSKSSVNFTVKANSVDTGVEKRNKHLKSPDFLHAKKHPEITFESTEVKKKDDKTFQVTGDLTIRDNTKEITVDVKHVGSGKDQKGNTRHGFYTEFEIDRTEFGVDWKPDAGVVGKTLRLIVAIEGVDKKS